MSEGLPFGRVRELYDRYLPHDGPGEEPSSTYTEILTGTGRHAGHARRNAPGTGAVRCSCGLYAPGKLREEPAGGDA